jgi:hypothetical protein
VLNLIPQPISAILLNLDAVISSFYRPAHKDQ